MFIAGAPAFICEMKSRSKTTRISKEQREFLERSADLGAFACIALGAEATWEAFQDYLEKYYGNENRSDAN